MDGRLSMQGTCRLMEGQQGLYDVQVDVVGDELQVEQDALAVVADV